MKIKNFFIKISLAINFLCVLLSFSIKIFKKSSYNTFMHIETINSIDIKKLKSMGIKNVILDWEYTIAQPDSYKIEKTLEAKFNTLKKEFNVLILTNNKVLRDRIQNYGVKLIITKGMKPSKKAFKDALLNLKIKESIYVGDSWLTDVIGASNIGLRMIRVKPLAAKKHNTRYFFGKIFRWFEETCYKIATR